MMDFARVDLLSSENTDANALFNASMSAFRDTLSDEDKASWQECENATMMIKELEKFCAAHSQHGKLGTCLRKIKTFSDSFEPFFDIINVFVQVKPEWFGLFWGSIRLIFKLGSNFVVFFEKITTMFQDIALSLPQYRRMLQVCQDRAPSGDHGRLLKIMSFMYSDIIDFCQQVYCIFTRNPKSHRAIQQIRLLGNVIWKPFNKRFADLQERISYHREIFEREIQIEDQSILSRHFENFRTFLQESNQMRGEERAKTARKGKDIAARQVTSVLMWVGNPEYRHTYESACRQRHLDTGMFLSDMPEYIQWRDGVENIFRLRGPETNLESWSKRFLSLQGKPGYGKTVMSTRIIDDLQSKAMTDHSTTAFFHFSAKLGLGYSKPIDAWRAIAVQLIRAHSKELATMDSLAILACETGSGQPTASAADVCAILKLLLFRFRTYLVVDGVDECEDSSDFLETLSEVSKISETRVLILSRPDLIIPNSLSKELDFGWKLLLTSEHNRGDIFSFARSEVDQMSSEGLFGARKIAASTLNDISTKANGMFLWIRLLISLLRSPALPPQERYIILTEANLLEGLEGLYSGILSLIDRKYRQERTVTGKIFKWIVGSLYPLNTNTLHAALAVDPGKPTTNSQYLVNYPDCIPHITCSLVEVNPDGDLSFIHISFKEYLQSTAASKDFPEFSLSNPRAIQAELATVCLSYLANDVRNIPLQTLVKSDLSEVDLAVRGDSYPECSLQQVLDMAEPYRFQLSKRYPLLRYATLCWPEHLRQCLQECATDTKARLMKDMRAGYITESRFEYKPSIDVLGLSTWTAVLSQFLTNQMAVTAWVEASWVFHLAPKVMALLHPIQSLREQLEPSSIENREVWWIAMGLEQLSAALNGLRREHELSLRDNPTIIWQEQIESATNPHFWPTLEAGKVFEPAAIRGKYQDSGAPHLPDRLFIRTSLKRNVSSIS